MRHEIFQNGLDVFASNVSVVKSANHPGVKGTGYVPYYLVFDHHGDLAYHHQGGPYHGGDGNAVLQRVRGMLKSVPTVYLGKEPYAEHSRLAKQFASGKKLKSALAALSTALAEKPEDAELARMSSFVERHVQRLTAATEERLATAPKAAFKELDAALLAFAGSPWEPALAEFAAPLAKRAVRKQHEQASKELTAARKRWLELDPVRGNAGDVLNPLDADFRSRNQRALKALRSQLEKATREGQDLPAGRHARALLALLDA